MVFRWLKIVPLKHLLDFERHSKYEQKGFVLEWYLQNGHHFESYHLKTEFIKCLVLKGIGCLNGHYLSCRCTWLVQNSYGKCVRSWNSLLHKQRNKLSTMYLNEKGYLITGQWNVEFVNTLSPPYIITLSYELYESLTNLSISKLKSWPAIFAFKQLTKG